jgi:hypothetical protein
VNSHSDKWISRRTKRLAIVIVSPIVVLAFSLPVCGSWSHSLGTKGESHLFLMFCGGHGILFNLVLPITIVLAVVLPLLAPISLLLDRRRWKKNNA